MKYFILILIGLLSLVHNTLRAQVEQILFNRVELMPNNPSPYSMRDWNAVALKYDSFVYDITKTGDYLPLVFIKPEGVNYPSRESFGLDTYVGTFSNKNGEGINVLPSLVSATLAGADKTDQFDRNWVLMSQDFFNKNNGENLYLNNIGGHSGGDWWYDMMPNVYFYQLYDLYGKIGDAESQFLLVANRMSAAVRDMGGKGTPWTRAFMDYRAYDFLHMQPNPDGVHEPEAAGTFAWLLYHAYKETGDQEYLKAAEWSMEYLINLNTNPSYELQLPYGAYIAAKMNAELGTEYNVEKLLFWIYNRGPLRGWGTIVGEWNGFDVSGLVGEANDGGNDYAFQLNGVQQAGQLVPLVRYDKRFARTVGKWMLNVANATRLMFPGFLPSHLQDASAWSTEYDPEGVIGYEALREEWQGQSPLATGDALRGGWAATNLSLYSTSSIGYMGSIIEKTDVNQILKLDLLKTDFFQDTAYPSYLLFNPFATSKTVSIDVGTSSIDVYDVITETFLLENVAGVVSLDIPADKVISIVLAPAGGTISYENNKMLIGDVVVDYQQTAVAYNYPPRIQAFDVENKLVEKNTTVTIHGKGIDQETKDLIYTFFLPNDTLSGLEKTASWTAPDVEGTYQIKLVVEDEAHQTDTAYLTLIVVAEINIIPEIIDLVAHRKYTSPGGSIRLDAVVQDLNNDPIIYEWSANGGSISGSGAMVFWNAPTSEGVFTIQVQVNDGRGGIATRSIQLLVLDQTLHVEGDLIAWYPFTGNALDISGNALNGQVLGAKLTLDSLGTPASAYFFDGVNDHIRVTNQSILNFTDGITVSLFVSPGTIGDKERFIISHGSWQNRWKLSITPENKIRWTLKNASGQVRDLDSETIINPALNYHVAATYNGRFLMLYINGRLESFVAFTGDINPSPVDLEIGQIMPDDASYNYSGDLDEVKIYNYALLPDSVVVESGQILTGIHNPEIQLSGNFSIFPNPSASFINIDLGSLKPNISLSDTRISILDVDGRILQTDNFGNTWNKKISVQSLQDGAYFIEIKTNQKRWIQSFIVTH
ncbi:MAG: T9SS type A sorting domain-containing protein [Bacteroidota bacterium]|nr:T9SS type A sorting domain-containing protein [Bacteroidota bacterium]